MTEKTIYQDTIIQRIKKLRETEGISQAKVSEILGISRGQVSNIENPNYPHKYTLKQIYTFCQHMDFPIEKVFVSEMENLSESSKAINSLLESIIKYECRED